MNFYAICTDKDNNAKVIGLNAENRHDAFLIAKEDAKLQGLTVENVYPVQSKQRQGSTITKYAKYRKKHNGDNPLEYDNSL